MLVADLWFIIIRVLQILSSEFQFLLILGDFSRLSYILSLEFPFLFIFGECMCLFIPFTIYDFLMTYCLKRNYETDVL